MRSIFCLLATALCFWSAGPAQAQPQDTADLAVQVGPKIATAIKGKVSGTPRVAVMPFSNSVGKVDPSFSGTVKSLQGELITALKTEKAGFVLDTRAIAKNFSDTATDPTQLDISDPTGTGTVLTTLKWDAVVMGQFDSTGPAALATTTTNNLKFSVTIIYQNGGFDQLESTGSKSIVPSPKCADPTGRFNVEILVEGKVLPFLTDPHKDSQYHNVKFLQIAPSMVGKEYQIRLTDRGTPAAGYASSSVPETERVFGVAVLIDGVDSFAHDTGRVDSSGKPLVDFEVVHPKNAQRWLLTSPGRVIRPDSSHPEGFVLADVSGGTDHSVRTISGYQMGAETAAAFVFAQSGKGELTAELLGVTEDIGMIEVYFYARKLDGDRMLPNHRDNLAGLGTKPGRDIKHGVFQVKPKMHTAAVEVWRIFYRTAGSFPVPDNSLVPFTKPGG